MREVVIAGIGQTPVGELWDVSLRNLAYKAIKAARLDAGNLLPQALYTGNFLASVTSHQGNLATLLADNAGLDGVEAFTVEAASASGGAAFQMGFMAVASGLVDIALVVGAEKFTDAVGSDQESAIAQSMDADYEAAMGLTLAGQAGLLMQRYIHESGAPRSAFGAFPVLAHANAVNNPNAMYRKAIRLEAYEKADMLSDPINLYDLASYADGAAAVILTTPQIASHLPHPLVSVRGAGGVIDTLAIHDRPDPLAFDAARYAVQRAFEMGGILPGEINFFELDDAFSIYAVLQLEAAGFAARGEGWRPGINNDLGITGKLPVLTMGGSKGRGNPLGATGVYQIVEACQQLRGEGGINQIPDARLALTLSLGGPASTAYAHVLERRNGRG